MRRFRPYIPLKVRVRVAERQLRVKDERLARSVLYGLVYDTERRKLTVLLGCLFDREPCHLDHDPALVNRRWNSRTKDYVPRANDPEHLIYRTKIDHDIKTRIRGIGAQRSDLGQARYNKRVARNRSRKSAKVDRIKHDGHLGLKTKVSRPLRSANRWPPRGSRKIANRRKPFRSVERSDFVQALPWY